MDLGLSFLAGLFVGSIWVDLLLIFGFFLTFLFSFDKLESGFLSTIGLLIFVGAVWLALGNPFVWIFHNPLTFLGTLAGYAGIGVGWSLFKWRKKIVSWYNENKDVDAPIRAVRKPKFDESTGDITFWITFWPTSMMAYFLQDLLVDFFELIFKGVKKLKVIYEYVEGKYRE